MTNYQLLMKWLDEAELSVTSLEKEEICYTNLRSKRFGGMEYSMFFGTQEEDVLVFNMTVFTPSIKEEQIPLVEQFIKEQNDQSDTMFEWWMNESHDINLLYARKFSDLSVKQGRLPFFYYILDYMVDEVDAHYLDLVNVIVGPPKNAEDPYAFLSFMRDTILDPEQQINLDREGTSWSADRFRGRLSGLLWAILDERKTPDIDITEVLDKELLMVVTKEFATAEEWGIVEQLRDLIRKYAAVNNHNHADGELGKWEGMAVYYHHLPDNLLEQEKDIEVN